MDMPEFLYKIGYYCVMVVGFIVVVSTGLSTIVGGGAAIFGFIAGYFSADLHDSALKIAYVAGNVWLVSCLAILIGGILLHFLK